MSELHLPSDYESLRPFRRLAGLLQDRRIQCLTASEPGLPTAADEVLCKMAASFLWNRLWCELALLARSTNKPGWLPREDSGDYVRTVAPIFGENCDPVDLLVQCGLLLPVADGWQCELFAELNPHCAGNFKTKEERGAHGSAVVRNRQRVAAESHQELMRLEQAYHKPDGSPMSEREALGAMNVIKSLDNALKMTTQRLKKDFTDGLMLDAYNASLRPEEDLTAVYIWVRTNREKTYCPKTAEAILADFNSYLKLATAT